MSKSAIKTITRALSIIAAADVKLPHLLNINDAEQRASWRNADHLACFMVRCLADCFEAETLDDIKNHGWDSMTDACQRYYESGLDLWNGKQWKETGHINAAEELERLAAMVDRWVKHHAELEHTAARARIAEKVHARTECINRIMDARNDEAQQCVTRETAHDMMFHNSNEEFVTIAVRNLQRSYAEDVNPLGYLVKPNGKIVKIESVEDCIDGDGFVNVFCASGTDSLYFSRKALVMWFMPEEAPEMDENQKATNEAYAERMLTCAVTLRINPHNFEKMMEVADAYALPVYMRKVWTDHGDHAIKALNWEPRKYESRQAALDSGDYDNYKSLAGGVLTADIERGLVVIESSPLIFGFARQTLESIANGSYVPTDGQTVQDIARALLIATAKTI